MQQHAQIIQNQVFPMCDSNNIPVVEQSSIVEKNLS
jgi:hypothetical protein